MTLTIDTHEHDLIKLMKTNETIFELATLETGDIKIESESNDIKLLFERKTIQDLVASIKDGRYREQKQRILAEYEPCQVTFIIEGAPSYEKLSKMEEIYGIKTSSLISSFISLQYRDGFKVVQTATLSDTYTYIMEIAKRVSNTPEKVMQVSKNIETDNPTNPTQSYISTLKCKTKKSANITPEVCYQLQLSQIPGISSKTAKDICDVYPTLSKLMETIKETTIKTDVFKSIAGIGTKKAEKIIEYLH